MDNLEPDIKYLVNINPKEIPNVLSKEEMSGLFKIVDKLLCHDIKLNITYAEILKPKITDQQ